MPSSFVEKLFRRLISRDSVALHLAEGTQPSSHDALDLPVVPPEPDKPAPVRKTNLFSFVDLADPFFSGGEIAGEELPGPILSILSARRFGGLLLFHTPHTRRNALDTVKEVNARYPDCEVTLHELNVSSPKDYSSLMGGLCRELRDLALAKIPDVSPPIMEATRVALSETNYVCVSSGTAEMRAAWFLVTALGILPAKLLQVGSPAYPAFGHANVKEVQLDTTDWETIRNLAMPAAYFLPVIQAKLQKVTANEPIPKDEAKPSLWFKRPIAPSHTLGSSELFEKVGQGGMADVDSAKMAVPDRSSASDLEKALEELDIYIGSAMLRLCAEKAAIAANSDVPILLLGETGTGKERFAQLIHRLSIRWTKEMAAINCAAIPKDLAESYLFGHVKGAFTGATSDKKGVFEHADKSTLFLDEIAELTPEIQAKLLRVIQEQAIQRLGSTTSRQVDVRIVAATNRDLKKEVAAGRFREDLYFRLEVVDIKLPALRDRRTEIPGLALTLLRKINQRRPKPRQLSKGALQRLENYAWPGNVRQLSNVLERSVLYARNDIVEADDLLIAEETPSADPLASLPEPSKGFSMEEYLCQVRKQLYLRAIEKCKGNRADAAALLGVSRQAVNKFMGELDNQG